MTKRRKSTTKPAQADPSLTARESDGETPKDNAASNEALSDLEYMRRRMRHKVAGGEGPSPAFEQSDSDSSDSEGDQDQDQDDEEDDEDDERDKEEAARRKAALEEQKRRDEENVDTIMESARLFVRNLPYSATEDELASFFSSYGAVEQVRVSLTGPCISGSGSDLDGLVMTFSIGTTEAIRYGQCGCHTGNKKDSRFCLIPSG